MNQKDYPELLPVAFLRIYVKKLPRKTPKVTDNWLKVPRVPDISVGESYLTINGATALKNPTQNPWTTLKNIKE